ncbi:hypothetical protein ON003_00390 [Janibacter hoylei]|uniref:hypothetical protein n=1 Tax=Janibacter hoylei TaxID=364298 RepID=UPI0022387BF5|nr:hypothetical protein [Janibacter hoylei]MCW4600241.1 hypothetical protein [Janibacter hoylei]
MSPEVGRGWTSLGSSALLVALGVALGAVNVAANFGLVPGSAWLAKVVGLEWGWLVAGFAAGWAGRTWRASFMRALTLLLPAVLVYVVADAVMIARTVDGTPPTPAAVVLEGLFWGVAAVGASVGLATVRSLIRVDGPIGMLAAAALPAYIAYSAWSTRRNLVRMDVDDPATVDVVTVLLPAAVATAIAAAVARGLAPRER